MVLWNELRSLASIKQIDDYGIFQMTYFGDYGFDDFLLVGAESDGDIEAFVIGRLLRGAPINLNITGAGCTVFAVRNDSGEVIFGRNFGFPTYSPSMQVITRPNNGYASVSTVNLLFLGYNENNLPGGLSFGCFPVLVAPYLPFDGVNEKGVAIALLAVPEADLPFYEGRVIYWDKDLKIMETGEDFQVAANFIPYNGLNIGGSFDEFERYDRVRSAILDNGGTLGQTQAVGLLVEAAADYGDGGGILHWTAIYNLSQGRSLPLLSQSLLWRKRRGEPLI